MIKEYVIDNIKNIALIGHSQTGKTMLVESMLFHSDAIKEMGSIERGTLTTDYEEEEIERKMTIRLAIAHTKHNNNKINFIDTPGLSDFSTDVICALRSSESALVVVDSESAIEIQTRKNWKLADKYNIPKAIVVSKMDKERANFKKAMEDISKAFEKPTIPLYIPIGEGNDFKGVIDVLAMKALYPDGKKNKEEDIPTDLKDEVEAIKVKLIESACETDEALMEKYFAEEKLTEEEILKGLKVSIKEQNFIPVLCSSVEKSIGMLPLLDFIANLMPSAKSIEEVTGIAQSKAEEIIKRKRNIEEPFSAFIFKTMIDPYAGRTSFLKVQSGKLRVGDEIINPVKDEKHKVGHLYVMQGKNRNDVSEVIAGDIVVITKLEKTLTGHTLCCPNNLIILQPLDIPAPVSFTAVRAESKKEEEKLNQYLQKITEEDPSFNIRYNAETRQTVIENNGQLQTEIALRKIEAKSNIKIDRSIPRIAYRETIKKKSDANYRHKKQSGGHGQFGEVHIEIEPRQRGEGFEFVNNIVGGSIPRNFIPAVEKGVIEAMQTGVLAEYPVMDVRVRLYDGKYHDVDSSEMSFKIAGRGAMKDALRKASPILLEPIMKVKISAPDDYTGPIMSDLNSKRAKVLGSNMIGGGLTEIEAHVPLVEMLKYSIDLKGITSGEGTFEMDFDHYEELQGKDAEKVVKEVEKLKNEKE